MKVVVTRKRWRYQIERLSEKIERREPEQMVQKRDHVSLLFTQILVFIPAIWEKFPHNPVFFNESETRGLTFRIIACQLVMPHPRHQFPVHKRYNQKILEFSRAFNLKFNLWCLIATLPDPSFQCTKECIRHSLIIGREGLILTLSILPCPQGRISWSTPCKRVHPRENSWALGMDFPIPRFGGARIQPSNFGIYLCRSRHFHPYTLIIAGTREHWQCMKLDRNVKDP